MTPAVNVLRLSSFPKPKDFSRRCRLTCNDGGEGSSGATEEDHVRTQWEVCQPAQAAVERGGEVPDLAAAAHARALAAPGGRAVQRGPDDDHADPPHRARGRASGV